MHKNTRDISEFGYREKDIAADLLKAHGTYKDKTRFLCGNVSIEFNLYSGYVFLVDEDCNVGVLNDNGELEDFITCPDCGGEGVASEFREDNSDDCCQEYADEMGLE